MSNMFPRLPFPSEIDLLFLIKTVRWLDKAIEGQFQFKKY